MSRGSRVLLGLGGGAFLVLGLLVAGFRSAPEAPADTKGEDIAVSPPSVALPPRGEPPVASASPIERPSHNDASGGTPPELLRGPRDSLARPPPGVAPNRAAAVHPWGHLVDREHADVWLRVAALDQKSQLALYDGLPPADPALSVVRSADGLVLKGASEEGTRVFWLSQQRGYLGEGFTLDAASAVTGGEARAVVVRRERSGDVQVAASMLAAIDP